MTIPSLCQVCRNAIQFRHGVLREQPDSVFLAHYANVQSLLFSANSNCFICYKLWHGLPPSERTRAMQPVSRPCLTNILISTRTGTGAIIDAVGSRSFSVSCGMPSYVEPRRLYCQQFYLQPDEGECRGLQRAAR